MQAECFHSCIFSLPYIVIAEAGISFSITILVCTEFMFIDFQFKAWFEMFSLFIRNQTNRIFRYLFEIRQTEFLRKRKVWTKLTLSRSCCIFCLLVCLFLISLYTTDEIPHRAGQLWTSTINLKLVSCLYWLASATLWSATQINRVNKWLVFWLVDS